MGVKVSAIRPEETHSSACRMESGSGFEKGSCIETATARTIEKREKTHEKAVLMTHV